MSSRISVLSRTLSLTASGFIVIIPLSIAGMWWFGSEAFLLSKVPQSWFIPPGILFEPGYLSNPIRISAAFVCLAANIPLLLALWQIRCLFILYARLELFIREAAFRMKKFAGYILIFALVQPFAGAVISYLTSMSNPPGKTFISISIADTDIATLLMGVTMFLIGYVLDEAHKLSEENNSFI